MSKNLVILFILFFILVSKAYAQSPDTPPCPDHDNNTFHTLYDASRNCHYDHEHGTNPFTPEVAAYFHPSFDLQTLLGGVQIGHTNPSSPMENDHKHGGFKWNVQLQHPQGCAGFEGSVNGVNGSVIEYHNFGDYSIEVEAPVHTTVALLRLCNSSNPTDYGYIYTTQFQSYGQIVVPYQGTVFMYPYYSVPIYDSPRGPYISVNCIGSVIQCRSSLSVAQRNLSSSTWTSKPTGGGQRPESSSLFRLLFRVRDVYQNVAWNDQVYPYTFIWLCTGDGGLTYNPTGCRYNNTTSQVHEIAGVIPTSWDNLEGFDTDSRVGRVSGEGFTTQYGQLNLSCMEAGTNCHPLKLVSAFTGSYGSVLVFTPGKNITNIAPYLPERDYFFCNGQVCTETSAGATASGWIGQGN